MITLVGHDQQWAEWRAALAGHRMHHGWILAGREGLGKATFALAAAAELVAEPGVPQPPPGHHPDIHLLEPLPNSDDEAKKKEDGRPYLRKRNINVDQVREMQRRLVTRPTLGLRRAVIIDAADQLEKGSVNALLKSLEEPPQGTFFLLVVHQLGRLLPTIRSRCTIMRFHPLAEGDLARALDAAAPGLDPATREAALAVSNGSPGAALTFAEQDLGKAWSAMKRLVTEGDPDFALRGELATAIGQRPDRDRIQAMLESARMILVRSLPRVDEPTRARVVEAHARLVTIAAQAPIYNFDAALLLMEIGGLLASVARTRESAS
ncbi:DNA polymerase III subunit delta' [Novosphingobium cyanobacteriorum]|uniref:DNA polymerase III subunit delta n=1 Tax=Novosphingobium cyanobacteriorum TaxID=3024215 RepID=A0ABT6CFM0_9SPHN|nr:DNA polymerase III subunit delta' [Novosphingobium cyanobacteriorum]MDF8331890.1 DNA polymerase III subunit delta' [Novosphingobium cyanobacteriorum]